ncbi:hypothetical protein [Desulfurococcus mucosus]|uniref:Uncharacterized protein n=1 Tax=Desulfurococcus mucosus (strain ATCC 35584 / DSM 2162 / JCM 9187 / O7/1) TaxID=765177 RepID=E8R8M0_DESM0|nr:hypothetical protein [Desulfurococcus mucosus]ADV64846.1 hypothetical protein Desmu_0536 [Desulfurococcus mucosus DSM 2162]
MVKMEHHVVAAALILILTVALTYRYPVEIAVSALLVLLGAWIAVTGLLAKPGRHEASVKTPTSRVAFGGLTATLGAALMVSAVTKDARAALIAVITLLSLTITAAIIIERKL